MDTWSFVFSGCFFEGPLGHGNHSNLQLASNPWLLGFQTGSIVPLFITMKLGNGWTNIRCTLKNEHPSKPRGSTFPPNSRGSTFPSTKKSSTNQPILYVSIMCTTDYHLPWQHITDTLPRHSNDFRSPLLWRRRQRWSTKRWEAHRPKSSPFKEWQVGRWIVRWMCLTSCLIVL